MFAITISIGFVQFPSWFGNFEGRPHHGIPQHHVALAATAPGSLDFEVSKFGPEKSQCFT